MHAASCELSILGIGLASALGRDAATSCAAARAGLSRARPLVGLVDADPELGEPEAIVGHSVFGVPASAQGVGRISLLARAGLVDLLSQLGSLKADKVVILFNLSDGFVYREWAAQSEGEYDGYDEYLKGKLSTQLGDSLRAALPPEMQACPIKVSFGGETGVRDVLKEALECLRAGEFEVVLLGGVDSLIDPHFASVQAEMGLLKSATRPDGATPGEGAAFLALSAVDCPGRGSRAQICLSDTSTDNSVFAEEPALGAAAAQSIRAVHDAVSQHKRFRFLISCSAGDYYRSNDFGSALSRLGDSDVATLPVVHVASSFGDTGAAAGFIAAIYAIWLLNKPAIPESAALIFIGGLGGSRCALSIAI